MLLDIICIGNCVQFMQQHERVGKLTFCRHPIIFGGHPFFSVGKTLICEGVKSPHAPLVPPLHFIFINYALVTVFSICSSTEELKKALTHLSFLNSLGSIHSRQPFRRTKTINHSHIQPLPSQVPINSWVNWNNVVSVMSIPLFLLNPSAHLIQLPLWC